MHLKGNGDMISSVAIPLAMTAGAVLCGAGATCGESRIGKSSAMEPEGGAEDRRAGRVRGLRAGPACRQWSRASLSCLLRARSELAERIHTRVRDQRKW